jgi:uncharacterized protein YndB with AHSA1/START domain
MRIELDVAIAAPPEEVFDALTVQVGSWWTMTFQTSSTVTLEPWEGGRFFESWREGGGIEYASVTRIKRGVVLAMHGAMGLSGEVDGEIIFTLAGTVGGTLLWLSHRATGPIEEGTEEHYRFGWTMLLLGAFKSFVETGSVPK